MLAQTSIDGGSAIAVIVIVAFAIERTVTGLLFLLPFNKQWAQRFPDPALLADAAEKARAEKRQKLLYYAFASVFGLIVACFGNVRLLHALGMTDSRVGLDIFLTALVLVAGSDILGHVQKLSGVPGSGKLAQQQPIEITGKLILEEGTQRKSAES